MVIVDTSVWITYQRRPDTDVGRHMDMLLAQGEVAMVGPVLTEMLQGASSDRELEFLSSRLRALEFFDTNSDTWDRAARINFELKKQGRILAQADVVIAALSFQNEVPIYTLDSDFDRIPGLALHQP